MSRLAEFQEGVRVERALPLWSKRLGLIGKADVVEFHGLTPYPVEYKHGSKREREHDDLQLCAQAICLEEMTGKAVPEGAIYYHSSRRRREVAVCRSAPYRGGSATAEIRTMVREKILPPPVNDNRCRHCSLQESCMPAAIGEKTSRRIATNFICSVLGTRRMSMHQLLNTLYVNTEGSYLRLDHDTLKVSVEKEMKLQVPLHHLGGRCLLRRCPG